MRSSVGRWIRNSIIFNTRTENGQVIFLAQMMQVFCNLEDQGQIIRSKGEQLGLKQGQKWVQLLDSFQKWIQIIQERTTMSHSQAFVASQPSQQVGYFNLDQSRSSFSLGLIQKDLARRARSSFIAKAYFLLILQLTIAFGMCLLSQYCQPFRNFQLDNPWLLVFPSILLMITVALAIVEPDIRQFPFDMVVLLLFVFSFSYIISFGCSQVVVTTPGPTVVLAIGSTLAIVIALTILTFCCGANFDILVGIIMIVTLTISIVQTIAIFTITPQLICVYCGLTVIAYGIYLVILTSMIIGGQVEKEFPMDNYIIASLLLFVYIIKIFVLMLRIFVEIFKGK